MDEDLRELERAAQRDDPEARTRLLAARRRAGRLDEERLSLAARLGDPVARALLGAEAPHEQELLAWLESVREQPWALEVTTLAAVVGARAALVAFEREYPEDRGPRHCVEAAEAVVACPCDEHRTQAFRAGSSQQRAAFGRSRRTLHLANSPARDADRAVWLAAQAASSDRANHYAVLAIQNALGAAHPQVRDATRSALVRWLLGV